MGNDDYAFDAFVLGGTAVFRDDDDDDDACEYAIDGHSPTTTTTTTITTTTSSSSSFPRPVIRLPSLKSIRTSEDASGLGSRGMMTTTSSTTLTTTTTTTEDAYVPRGGEDPEGWYDDYDTPRDIDRPTSHPSTSSTSSTGRVDDVVEHRSTTSFCPSIYSSLRAHFDVDTMDVSTRVISVFTTLAENDGFRRGVLYRSDDVVDNDDDYDDDDDRASGMGGGGGGGGRGRRRTTTRASASAGSNDDVESIAIHPPIDDGAHTGKGSDRNGGGMTSAVGKGPDLYGPFWITMTVAFSSSVTSNVSLYLHHSRVDRTRDINIIEDGGIEAEEVWDYDVNRLLHATWILYAYSLILPSILCVVLRLLRGGGGIRGGGGVEANDEANDDKGNLGPIELICLYGYSLVPYLPATWMCVLPYDYVQWSSLILATCASALFVLRNVVGTIMRIDRNNRDVGDDMRRKSGGGLVMCLVGCHVVFLLVMKLTFYHHHDGIP